MEIVRHFDWFPSFKNQIDIIDKTIEININRDEVEITCDWDYGWGGRGTERMYMPLAQLKALIKELEDSESDGVNEGVNDGVNE